MMPASSNVQGVALIALATLAYSLISRTRDKQVDGISREAPGDVADGVKASRMTSDGPLLVISGASKGIGLATAKLFRSHGWAIVNISRSPCPLLGVKNLAADFAFPGWEINLESLLNGPENKLLPRKICLVHNAGMYTKDSALDIDIRVLRQIFEVNVVAPAALNKMFLSSMTDGSSIIYVGSTLSEKGVAGNASYVASKHAVAGLMKVTCQDLSGRSIHSACVCPGFTETEMLSAHLSSNPAFREQVISMHTMGRLLKPAEIANAIFFCAENPSINGSVIHCNLGQVER